MNQVSLNDFKKEINEISEYFRHIEHISNVISLDNCEGLPSLQQLQEHHIKFRTSRKKFEYKASIISLYGLLERYIEIWIHEYLGSLCKLIDSYARLDEKLQENHFDLSVKLIAIITSRENAKYQHLSKEIIINKLHKCISNSDKYSINPEAFTISSGNLKHKRIVSLFETINISLNSELKINKTLQSYFQSERQISNIANLSTENLFNIIDDLVERRNQIAHGSDISDILDISALEPYLRFLEKYCQAVFEILNKEIIKQESIHKLRKITKVIKVINNSILAFEIENKTIRVGDSLIVETVDGDFYKTSILSIQLNNQSYQEIEIADKREIGVKVDCRIKENQSFYI
jgi:RiboL-PSP-HEPN